MDKATEARVKAAKEMVEKAKRALAEAESDLLNAYEDRYPDGRFYICRMGAYWGKPNKEPRFELHWEKGRDRLGLTNSNYGHDYGYVNRNGVGEVDKGVYKAHHRCSINRRTTTYNSLDKLIKAAQKFMVPLTLVESFVAQYNAKVGKKS